MLHRLGIFNNLIRGSFLLLVFGLGYTQIIKGPEYFRLSEQNRIRLIPIIAPRGIIYDRNGQPIVSNKLAFDIVIIPQELKDKETTFIGLSKLIEIDKEEIENIFKKNYLAPFAPVIIKRNLDRRLVSQIEENKLGLPGVFVQTRAERYYHYPESTSHIIGYLGEINKKELEYLKTYGYKIKDLIGRAGIERLYDTFLRGDDGGMQLEVDNRGRLVEVLGQKEPFRGNDIQLTIDIKLQDYIFNIMESFQGACVVMDVNNGEVLALVSKPSFNPTIFLNSVNKNKIRQLLTSKKRPFLNRAVSGLYQPASVFKLVVAIAALENKKISPYTEFTCSGVYKKGNAEFECWKKEGHGNLDLRGAIANSCNVYFYKLGSLIGADLISRYALEFGFGRPTGIRLVPEAKGLVPTRMWKLLTKGENWYEGETLSFAIGHGYLLSSPLQVTRFISAIANGGKLVQPQLIRNRDENENLQKVALNLNISNETMKIIKEAMLEVVERDYGTGHNAKLNSLDIAGKTGTTQQFIGKPHAWFTGFAPFGSPKFSVVVFLEHGGSGGADASIIASKIFQKMQELKFL
ncbi:MAG: penicillin-binding protein 2 [Candidatus Omnitrophica bacterium]|nr:penicillin-binding protein 2 [Candidatus Omnitrophota bacterium]